MYSEIHCVQRGGKDRFIVGILLIWYMVWSYSHCCLLHELNVDEVRLRTVRPVKDEGNPLVLGVFIPQFSFLTASMFPWSHHAAAPPQILACRRRATTQRGFQSPTLVACLLSSSASTRTAYAVPTGSRAPRNLEGQGVACNSCVRLRSSTSFFAYVPQAKSVQFFKSCRQHLQRDGRQTSRVRIDGGAQGKARREI